MFTSELICANFIEEIYDGIMVIVDFFQTIIDFIVNLVQDLIFVVQLLADVVLNIPNYIGWLPTTCISMLVVGFSVVVIYKILGREG